MKPEESVVELSDSLKLRNSDEYLYDSCLDLVTRLMNENPNDTIENALQKACILLSYGIHNVNVLDEEEIFETANSLLTRMKDFCYNLKND